MGLLGRKAGTDTHTHTHTHIYLLSPRCAVQAVLGCHSHMEHHPTQYINRISGLVVEYIVAIDVTRVRFPADANMLHGRSSLADVLVNYGHGATLRNSGFFRIAWETVIH